MEKVIPILVQVVIVFPSLLKIIERILDYVVKIDPH